MPAAASEHARRSTRANRRNRRAARALLVAAALASSSVAGQAQEPFLAEVRTFAFDFCPRGHAGLYGQLLPINQNQALFALVGTLYGGDGRVTFALPTATPIITATGAPLTQCIALQGIFPSQN